MYCDVKDMEHIFFLTDSLTYLKRTRFIAVNKTTIEEAPALRTFYFQYCSTCFFLFIYFLDIFIIYIITDTNPEPLT